MDTGYRWRRPGPAAGRAFGAWPRLGLGIQSYIKSPESSHAHTRRARETWMSSPRQLLALEVAHQRLAVSRMRNRDQCFAPRHGGAPADCGDTILGNAEIHLIGMQ